MSFHFKQYGIFLKKNQVKSRKKIFGFLPKALIRDMLQSSQEECCMPRGPQGQKRPADPARNALKILKIAIGEIQEKLQEPSEQNIHARAKTLTKAQRSAIARKAAYARWHKVETATE
jgi:hypothetical protein